MTRVGRVVSITSGSALIEVDDRSMRALTVALPDVAVGEDVLVTSGLIVGRLSPEEAEARRQLFAEMIALAAENGPS
jgi:hydrogenase maturation factor